MASKSITTIALLLTLNLLFFTMVSSTSCPPPPKKHVHPVKPSPTPSPVKPSPTPSPVKPSPTPVKPSPTPTPVKPKSCPINTLKLGACGNVLNNLMNIVVGTPSKTACCSLITNLADLDAAVCLCTALKANILGINLNVPLSLSVLLNYCGKKETSGYKCK